MPPEEPSPIDLDAILAAILGDSGGSSGGSSGPAPKYPSMRNMPDGSVWLVDPYSGLPTVQVMAPPAAPPKPVDYSPDGPGAPGDTGYNPSTGLPWGVFKDSNSPSGYMYQGKPVNPDGSLYTGGPKQEEQPTTILTRADGSKALINTQTGAVIAELSGAGGGGGGGSSFPVSNRPITQGATGGGGSGSDRNYLAEQTAQNQWQMEYLAAQQAYSAAEGELNRAHQSGLQGSTQQFQALENARNRMQQAELLGVNIMADWRNSEADRQNSNQQQVTNLIAQWQQQQSSQDFQGAEKTKDRILNILSTAQQSNQQARDSALNRNQQASQFGATYGLQRESALAARRQDALNASNLLSQQGSDTDPFAYIAWLESGGNNLANAMAFGEGSPISSRALAGAAGSLRTIDHIANLPDIPEYQWTPEEVSPYQPINVDEWLAKIGGAGSGGGGGGGGDIPAWLQQAIAGLQGSGGSNAPPQWLTDALTNLGSQYGTLDYPQPPGGPVRPGGNTSGITYGEHDYPGGPDQKQGAPADAPAPGMFSNPQTASDPGFYRDPWTGMFDEFGMPLQAQRPGGVHAADWNQYMQDFTNQQNSAQMAMGAIGPQYGQPTGPSTTAPHLAPNVGPVTYSTTYTPGATGTLKKKKQTTVIPGLSA